MSETQTLPAWSTAIPVGPVLPLPIGNEVNFSVPVELEYSITSLLTASLTQRLPAASWVIPRGRDAAPGKGVITCEVSVAAAMVIDIELLVPPESLTVKLYDPGAVSGGICINTVSEVTLQTITEVLEVPVVNTPVKPLEDDNPVVAGIAIKVPGAAVS
ncbi:MAG: hypothetical protein ACYDED_15085 [Ferrimicrobium sp.]